MTRDHLHDEIERVAAEQSLTILFVTHNMREADPLADRLVLIECGPHPPRAGRRPASPTGDGLRRRGHARRGPHLTAPRGRRCAMTTVLTPVVGIEAEAPAGSGIGRSAWAWVWPKLLAVGLVLAVWQVVVWLGWRPEYVLPGPAVVLGTLAEMIGTPKFWQAVATTLTRAVVGFSVALVVGSVVGILVARIRPLRLAIGALITGLQTMPSIAWFPLAILLFGLNEQAIMFVVVLGAAPSVANGVISGIDHVPPAFTRLGRVLGRGSDRPVPVHHAAGGAAGLRVRANPGLGLRVAQPDGRRAARHHRRAALARRQPRVRARQFSQADRLLATMLVVLVLGMLVDGVFSSASRRVRHRWGLAEA